MAIINNKKLDKSAEKEIYTELLKEFKRVNSFDDLDGFLNKFMTPSEKTTLFRRIAVIKLLGKNKKYRDIRKSLGISSGTISNIKDIIAGRGYSKNPDRKRKYSEFKFKKQKKFKPYFRKYKGAVNILDML